MPDRRRHRGRHPQDERLFSEDVHATLRKGVAEYSWLLTRGYAVDSALKLVGDRHALSARQRMAVRRCACTDQALKRRHGSCKTLDEIAGSAVGVDGYNLLITLESALSGGLIMVGRDGAYRDLASVHGSYRKVEETDRAIRLAVAALCERSVSRIDWYLDRPVSNSGRLKALIADVVESDVADAPVSPVVNIELVDSPDRLLMAYDGIVATSDSVVLDSCDAWVNMAAEIIDTHVADAWKLDLR